MGYILLNYDIKWPNRDFLEAGDAPAKKTLGVSATAPDNVAVMFRRRISVDHSD